MKLLIVLFFIMISLKADRLSFGNNQTTNNALVYTVQIFSTQNMEDARTLLKIVPHELQDETKLYKIGNYFKGRYSKNKSYNMIKPFVKILRKAGFHDAYVLKSTLSDMDKELLSYKSKNQTQKHPSVITLNEPKIDSISKFAKADIILKAESAYKRGDESEAILYYEMLLASGYYNKKIKNNLSYLYGKRGAWLDAKTLIDKEYYQINLLYAYAYGAVESNQEEYYNNLSPYIMIDKSGMLMLLSGCYFEQKNDLQRAFTFYKMAYKKNPTNPYLIFAYARSADIQNKLQKAKKLYENTLGKINKSHPLYKATTKRILQIQMELIR